MELLIQLRWTAAAGQIATILVVHDVFRISLPLVPMFGIIAALVALNLISLSRMRRQTNVSNRELFVALMLDVGALTAQLYLSGGATNPFTSLYLLQVTLGAVLLDSRSIWLLVAVTCTCLAALTFSYMPLEMPQERFGDPFSLYVVGMFIGFALNAILLVIFVTRINRNLRDRDAHLADLRQRAAEETHIVRMGLLASGAAHELGTPLASISVILSDWRRISALASNPDIKEDLAEMEAAIQRCKSIVTGILVSAGETRGESSSVTTVNTFMSELADEWRTARSNDTLIFENNFGADVSIASDAVLKQVIFNVLDNALEASPRNVELKSGRSGDALVIEVDDHGPGFSPDTLADLGRPYNSTKGRAGSGLGLFLVVNVLRKLGGHVHAKNRPDGGASVTLTLPLAILAIGGGDGR